MSKFDLAGRKALVTGGARGLGAGMAAALSKAGAAVMIGDVLADVGRDTAKIIAAGGAKAGFVTLDVTDDASWQAAVSKTIAEFGGFDILVNNAGVEITSLVINVEARDLRRMCDVNVVGTALGMKHAFPGDETGRTRRQGRRGRQHCLRGGDHRVPGDRRLFRDQIGRRPADPGRRDGVRQARLWRPRQLHLSRPRSDRHGHATGERRRSGRPFPERGSRRRRRDRARRRSPGSARSTTWRTPWFSSLRMRPGSSPAPGLPVDGGMGM